MTDAPRPMAMDHWNPHWMAQLPDVDRIGGHVYEEGRKIVCNSGPMITYAPYPGGQLCGVFSDLEAVAPALDACVPNARTDIIDCIAIHYAPYTYVPSFESYVDCLNEQGARIPVGADGYRGGGGPGVVGSAGIDGAFCWPPLGGSDALGSVMKRVLGGCAAALLGVVIVLNRSVLRWGRGGVERKRERKRKLRRVAAMRKLEKRGEGEVADTGDEKKKEDSELGNDEKASDADYEIEESNTEGSDDIAELMLTPPSETEDKQQAKGGVEERKSQDLVAGAEEEKRDLPDI